MRVNLLFLCLLATCLTGVSASERSSSHTPTKQAPGKAPEILALDTNAIHALYMDGEFESAIGQLEGASRNGLLKTHSDSVFAYKHLGVMYAAQYETMEKGKGYMYRLLSIEPTVKILDMYASEMIYMIFRNVQAEFQIRTADPKTLSPVSAPPIQSDNVKGTPKVATKRHRVWPYWTAGALALAGIGTTAFFLLEEHPSSSSHYDGGL